MKLVVGLGNIGQNYTDTRHNAGFMSVDTFAEKFSIKLDTCQYFQDCEIYEYGDYDELEQKKAYYADRIAAYQQELNDYEHQIRLLQNIR